MGSRTLDGRAGTAAWQLGEKNAGGVAWVKEARREAEESMNENEKRLFFILLRGRETERTINWRRNPRGVCEFLEGKDLVTLQTCVENYILESEYYFKGV